MKQYIKEFLKRGLMAASGGPVILALIYGGLDSTGVIDMLPGAEVSTGILTITLMAFIAAGITVIYQIERLPLLSAILIHFGVLYLDYLLVYLANSWIPRDMAALGGFTAVFVISYAITWLCIYLCIRRKTENLNKKLAKK